MWRQWVEDSPSSLAILFSNEVSSGLFEPELVIKDPAEVDKVKNVLLDNFDTISNYYIVKLLQYNTLLNSTA